MANVDPAIEAIETVITAMAEMFDPDSAVPPPAGGTKIVHFFAGEGPAAAAWNIWGGGCEPLFVWVQVVRRYRTKRLPEISEDATPCAWPRAIKIEVGVGRCAVIDEQPTWQQYDDEADTSLDDSWRVECALSRAAHLLQAGSYLVATGPIEPFGPLGGILGWTGLVYVQFG